jgi:hypothetical protein
MMMFRLLAYSHKTEPPVETIIIFAVVVVILSLCVIGFAIADHTNKTLDKKGRETISFPDKPLDELKEPNEFIGDAPRPPGDEEDTADDEEAQAAAEALAKQTKEAAEAALEAVDAANEAVEQKRLTKNHRARIAYHAGKAAEKLAIAARIASLKNRKR